MKTILVPVDLSEATPRVGEAALTLARAMEARLLLLHVVQNPPFIMNDYYAFDTGAMTDVLEEGRKTAARQLKALGEKYARRGVAVRTKQILGTPVAEILAVAKAKHAAYIVIGSHGHGAVFDLLVGSTTHGILRKARCPVLVVPMAGT